MADGWRFQLRTSGNLYLNQSPTLADVEAFCVEARRLGVNGEERLLTSRQGLMGPVSGWYFNIPVVPSKLKEDSNG